MRLSQESSKLIAIILPALLRMAALATVGYLVNLVWGVSAGLWCVVIGFGALLAIHLYYLAWLGRWVERPTLEGIPSGFGAWAEVFTRLYRARRASERNERRLLENEMRFRSTISALPEGIVLIDDGLHIEWCNPVAQLHLGISLGGDQGLRLTNLVRDPSFVAYMTSSHFEHPLTFTPLANPAMALSVLVVRFDAVRSIVITRDVTQNERLDAMRRDFVANVSHELRTPLTVVNGFLETLLEDAPADADTQRRHMRLMHEQAIRMQALVEDLLILSRLESHESPPAEDQFNVYTLTETLLAEARALSSGRHVIEAEFPCGDPQQLMLIASHDELRSAFGNLVSNAVRYTPDGGKIVLRWMADDTGARFEVQDTGIGIGPEHIPRLTERFYRVDKGRSRQTGGTGLGLAIVKHVLLRHGGRLEVRSVVGEGSVFSACLPIERVQQLGQGRPKAA